jgi:hypothetical protein
VRSWPAELSYDTYEVGHLLDPKRRNVIAVLVLHFGVTNFYYLRGRGGLLAQLDFWNKGKHVFATGSDQSWQTSRYIGQDSRSARMSCQHGFSESIDARLWDSRWIEPEFDECGWEAAVELGEPGMAPWFHLQPRDIPYLTEEPKYPVRVVSLSKVKPVSWTTTVDLRNHVQPESTDHANHVGHAGFVATIVRVPERAKVTLGFINSRFNFGPCSLNGVWYMPDRFYGDPPHKFLDVELNPGDNFFMMDVTGNDHGDGFHMGIDCGIPFELVSPWSQHPDDSPFVTLGPFAVIEHIDHQRQEDPTAKYRAISDAVKQGKPLDLQASSGDPALRAYIEAHSLASASDLERFRDWIRPIPNRLVSREDVFAKCVWKRESVPQPVPMSLQNAVIAHSVPATVPVFEDGDTEWIVDFGVELSGYITFEVEAAEGTVLDFYGFEYMHEDWRQDTHRLDHTLRYVCRGGRQTYASPIRRGFRYLMVTVRNAARPVRFYHVHILQSNYPVAEIGRFHCSDPLLNDIWQISKHTTRLCMEDTFVDCPAYEQTFWVGDSRNEALVNYYVFGAIDIVRRCMRLVPGSKFMTPLYVNQVPSGWNSVIPNWTFFWAIACAEYYWHTGDRDFAEEMWPHVKYTLDHYLRHVDGRGLLYMKAWNFLDWAPIDQPRDGVVSHQNMFLAKALREAAALAEAAGDSEGAENYRETSGKLREAINNNLWSEERSAYLDCIHADGRPSDKFSMQTQVVAHLCDIAQGSRLERIESYLLSPPADFVQLGSAFMSFFYYESLAKIGQYEAILDDIRRNYGVMIEFESSTCWEAYPKSLPPNPKKLTRSHCHAWSAAPGYFLGAHILGVRSGAPGWRKVIIEPHPAGLAWARGAVPLPDQGWVEVSWKVQENTIYLRMSAPAEHEIEVRSPEGYRVVVERQNMI